MAEFNDFLLAMRFEAEAHFDQFGCRAFAVCETGSHRWVSFLFFFFSSVRHPTCLQRVKRVGRLSLSPFENKRDILEALRDLVWDALVAWQRLSRQAGL
jgi:hypothetical protein